MISPKELRIGNFVNEVEDGLIIIKSISGNGNKYCVTDQNGNINGSDFILPIPLTEELLVKSGFKEDFNTSYNCKYVKNGVAIHVKGVKESEFFFIYDLDHDDIVVKVKYFHSLQNIVFDLTGEELTIIT